MKKRFTIARINVGKFADGIKYGKHYVLTLEIGTQINEWFVEWVVDRLNGKDIEPPFIKEREELLKHLKRLRKEGKQ